MDPNQHLVEHARMTHWSKLTGWHLLCHIAHNSWIYLFICTFAFWFFIYKLEGLLFTHFSILFILPHQHILFIFPEHSSLHVEFLPPRILTFPRFMNPVFLFSESIFDLLTFDSLLSSLVVTDYDFKLVPHFVSLTQIGISQSNFVRPVGSIPL